MSGCTLYMKYNYVCECSVPLSKKRGELAKYQYLIFIKFNIP